MKREDISRALLSLGRRSPTSRYIGPATRIALLAPYFASEPLENLDATFYHIGSYEGDLEQFERLRELVKGYGGER